MNINGKRIKEILAKGFVLITITGTLVSTNPKSGSKKTVIHAAVDLTETKSDAVAELKAIYKKYSKKYYTSSKYSKIINYYKKGVKAINAATSENGIETAFEKYKALIEKIKPSKLVKYQKKMETSLLKTYKKLIENFDLV